RRAEHVPGRMKADAHAAERDGLAVRFRFDDRAGTETPAEQRRRLVGAEIRPRARPRVIAVGMRDDGPIHGAPRIDVEIARGAEEAVRSFFEHGPSSCYSERAAAKP